MMHVIYVTMQSIKNFLFSLVIIHLHNVMNFFIFDIWGPLSNSLIRGKKYFITTPDDHSRFTWIILCQSKSEVSVLVQRFILMIEKHHDCRVKTLRTDNGPEFLMLEFYSSKDIEHQTSYVETPLTQW